MAGSKSDFLENLVLNTIIGKSTDLTAAIPSTLWIVLLNTTINDAWGPTDTGEVGTTAAADNYTRYNFTNSTANWLKATTGLTQNKTEFEFTASASTGWGTVKSFALVTLDSTSAGEAIYWGDLTSPVAVTAGNVVRFSTGTMIIGEL
jgi:hypothetical protein